jgi:hypothetical protein
MKLYWGRRVGARLGTGMSSFLIFRRRPPYGPCMGCTRRRMGMESGEALSWYPPLRASACGHKRGKMSLTQTYQGVCTNSFPPAPSFISKPRRSMVHKATLSCATHASTFMVAYFKALINLPLPPPSWRTPSPPIRELFEAVPLPMLAD